MTKPPEVYAQCILSKGDHLSVAWIPVKFAVVHRAIKIKQDDGSWDTGWTVLVVHAQRVGAPDTAKLIRAHRRNTGDSQPKKPRERK